MTFPKPIPSILNEYYGNPVSDGYGQHSGFWETDNLTRVVPPYLMEWAWDGTTVKRIAIHRKCAPSLLRVLQAIGKRYNQAEIQKYELHRCGGGFNFRAQTGDKNKLSIHSWGAAFDLAPSANPYNKAWTDGMIPLEVVALFKAEGWRWGGDFVKHPDCMHFQATL